ncbi:hypothetical protein A0H81_03142 [Grifola frondosa]|uniref:Uncharacterized protein n=1 Tax=Grifola frondosa TaxID=5627 RepID=A0A1C7MI58_GRIFR|nr:hypothetical protein A0H81_03142 [Grifola frondosa]
MGAIRHARAKQRDSLRLRGDKRDDVRRIIVVSAKRRARRSLAIARFTVSRAPVTTAEEVAAFMTTPLPPAPPHSPIPIATISSYHLLPKMLSKPDIPEIDKEKLAAFEPSYAKMDLMSLKMILVSLGPRMFPVFKIVISDPPKRALRRKLLPVLMADSGLATSPTHAFAIYQTTRLPPLGDPARTLNTLFRRRKAKILVGHAEHFATFCSRIPALPRPDLFFKFLKPPTETSGAVTAVRMPVIPLAVPDPDAFDHLQQYFYSMLNRNLLFRLIPHDLRIPDGANLTDDERTKRYIEELGATCTVTQLAKYARTVYGLYQNAIALGISHDGLWHTIDYAWNSLTGAMRVAAERGAA